MSKTREYDAAPVQRSLPDRVASVLGQYRRGGRRGRAIRRALAVVLLLGAGGLAMAAPASHPAGTRVYTAAHDLAIGQVLTAADLAVSRVPDPPAGALLPDAAPLSGADPAGADPSGAGQSGAPADAAVGADPTDAGALARGSDPIGRVTAGPVRAGEILTDVRLVDGAGLDPGPGRSAVPIRLPDAGVAGLLRPGMSVTVVSIGQDSRARALTDHGVVLAVPGHGAGARDDPGAAGGPHGSSDDLVVVSVPDEVADAVSAAALTHAVALRFGTR